MTDLSYTEVFVAGGFPKYTYNPRDSLQLEERLSEVLHNLCKLVTVTGHTKSGKTVLVRKILPNNQAPYFPIWIEGGSIKSEIEFWDQIACQYELPESIENQISSEKTTYLTATLSGEAGLMLAKAASTVETSSEDKTGTSERKTRNIGSKLASLQQLAKMPRPIIIDDFHYISKTLQGELIRSLKPLIFNGLPVVIIAIPHHRYDSIKVEREMTSRILPVSIPLWSEEELKVIADLGFTRLNIRISTEIIKRLTEESIGSPHLMQEFCRAICRKKGLISKQEIADIQLTSQELEKIFQEIAENIGRPIFDKLARGPRQRKDRIERLLKNGQIVDIYQLVLRALAHALKHLEPGLVSLEYEAIRTSIKEVSAEEIPKIQEIARVLKHMSTIAATDRSSTPVIEFDEEEKLLHITDPYFAFFLRWGQLDLDQPIQSKL